jgi:hypothetical protein
MYTHAKASSPESPWRSSRSKLNNLILLFMFPVAGPRNIYSFRLWPFNRSCSFSSSWNWKNSQELLLLCFPYFFCLSLCSPRIFSSPSHLLQCAVHTPLRKAIRIPLAILCSFMDECSVFRRRVKAVKGNPCSRSITYSHTCITYCPCRLMYP